MPKFSWQWALPKQQQQNVPTFIFTKIYKTNVCSYETNLTCKRKEEFRVTKLENINCTRNILGNKINKPTIYTEIIRNTCSRLNIYMFKRFTISRTSHWVLQIRWTVCRLFWCKLWYIQLFELFYHYFYYKISFRKVTKKSL